jgi:uncharacterized protein YlxP (DUF503 family)
MLLRRMFVGVLRLHLTIVDARSLKDKRRVVRSLKDRLTTKLRVSVAEVGELESPKHAWLGVAVVSNEAAHADSVLEEAAAMASTLPDAVLCDRATEIVPFGRGGTGVRGGIEDALRRGTPETGLPLGGDELGSEDDDDDRW